MYQEAGKRISFLKLTRPFLAPASNAFAVTALDEAGYQGALSAPGPGVSLPFASPNAALENLPSDFVAKLLDVTWLPHLQDLILYHGLPGSIARVPKRTVEI